MRRPRRRGYLLAASAAALWAFSGNLGKFGMEGELAPLTLSQGRTLVAVIGLALFVFASRSPGLRVPRRAWLWLLLFGALLGLVQYTYFAAIERIQVAAAILLEYLAPGLVVAYAWLVQKRPASRRTLVALGAAVAGCALVVRAYDPASLSLSAAGVAFGLAAAASFAGYILVGEHVQEDVPVAPRLLLGFAIALVLLLVLQPPWRIGPGELEPRSLIVMLLVGTFGTLLPFSAFMASLHYLDAGRATIVSTLEPVIAGLIAYVWFEEVLSLPQLVGAALVLGAVMALQSEGGHEALAPPEAALEEPDS